MSEELGEVKHFSREDRDLLIAMHEQIKSIKADIKELKDGTSITLHDHDLKIQKNREDIIQIKTWGTVAGFLLGILQFILAKFL